MSDTDSTRDWCIHYRGLQYDTCEASVDYDSVAAPSPVPLDNPRFGIDNRLPCFKRSGVNTCPSQRFRTEEEAKAKDAEIEASIRSWVNKLANDICPHCDTPIQREVQVGRCVYAEPCNHRLYQGRAKRKAVPA